MTRLTLSASTSSRAGPITVLNSPLVNSDSGEVASLARSSDFGVMMISGLRNMRTICRRSTWKIWLAVVGCTTCMLLSAASCMKRSRRAELCSGSLPFVAVRQHQRDAVDAAPFHFADGDELVDDDLRAVDEVAELAFPDRQRVRLGARVAVLETEHRFFRQDRVDDDERRLAVGHVAQRHVGAVVPLLAVLVVQHGVAVHEGAAPAVLRPTGARRSRWPPATRTRGARPCPNRH